MANTLTKEQLLNYAKGAVPGQTEDQRQSAVVELDTISGKYVPVPTVQKAPPPTEANKITTDKMVSSNLTPLPQISPQTNLKFLNNTPDYGAIQNQINDIKSKVATITPQVQAVASKTTTQQPTSTPTTQTTSGLSGGNFTWNGKTYTTSQLDAAGQKPYENQTPEERSALNAYAQAIGAEQVAKANAAVNYNLPSDQVVKDASGNWVPKSTAGTIATQSTGNSIQDAGTQADTNNATANSAYDQINSNYQSAVDTGVNTLKNAQATGDAQKAALNTQGQQAVTNATGAMQANQAQAELVTNQTDADLAAKFEETKTEMAKTQEESNAKTEALLTKMGESATADLLKKFDETQKATAEAMQSYFDEQQKYLTELQSQPSAIDQLNQFREQQGLPQMEKELALADQTILQTESLLSNIEADIKKRVEGLPVSEAAARRLQAMESAPLSKQLSEQLNARQRIAAGLEAKMNTVKDYMTAAQSDLATKKENALTKLGFSKEQAAFKGDVAQQGLQMFQTVQDKMNQVDSLRLDTIKSDADYKNKLSEMGFNFYQQQSADKKAAATTKANFQNELVQMGLTATQAEIAMKRADINDTQAFTAELVKLGLSAAESKAVAERAKTESQQNFQNELIKINLENELSKANKDYGFQIVQGDDGTFYSIATEKNTGNSQITSLNVKGETTQPKTASTSVINTNGHSYLINDSTGQTIKDLGVANSEISQPSAKPTEAETERTAVSGMMTQLNGIKGNDGFISPDNYKKAKNAWVAQGFSAKSFDDNFSYMANPDDPGTLKAYGLNSREI